MSSKHTPGPWEVSHGGHGSPHGFVIDEYYVLNRTVADDVAIAADIVDPATQMPSEANARLIAAAPELLEALSKAVRETEQFLFDAWLVRVCPSGDVESVQRQWLASSDHRDFVDEWREQIDAIAKATGGAQ
ncbi:hypothetical protein ACSYS7_001747 [Stenotrophomonas maltophilia]